MVAAGILLSRVAGLAREVVLGVALSGLSAQADAFRFAMRIPNVLQNLLGEGALSASFIPVYARLVEEGDEGEADELAGTIAALLAAVTAVLVAIGVLAADPLVRIFTSWENDPDKLALAATLTRITTIGLGFLVLSAWCLGVLNSHRRFFLPYSAPVLWNLIQIVVLGAAVVADWELDTVAIAAAWAVLVGGFAQFAVQFPLVRRLSPRLLASVRRTSEVDDVVRRFGPAVGSRGVVQISSFIDLLLAGALVEGALAAYTFALPLYLLPISLFGFSVAASELAEMSRRSGQEEVVASRVRPALRRVIVPAGFVVAVYLAAGRPVVDGLYGWVSRLLDRGFDAEDVTIVSLVVTSFALGLPAAMTARITQNTLYSVGEVRGPAKIAAIRMAVSAMVALVLMLQLDWLFVTDGTSIDRVGDVPHWPPWERVPSAIRADPTGPHLGAVGLALGAAVAAWVEWWLLRRMLRRRLDIRVRSGWARIVVTSALSAAVAMGGIRLLGLPSPIDIVVIGVVGVGIFGAGLWMQGVRSLPQLASSP
jgi:putative peptidoglycan lipid II flippase